MHGLIMEKISHDYAEKMHESTFRPFSQAVRYENDQNNWTISTLNKEAFNQIIPFIQSIKSAFIDQKNDTVTFGSPLIKETSYDAMFLKNYINTETNRIIKLQFLTPVSFKHQGTYINMPTPKLILSGIAKKYDLYCDRHETLSDELFDQFEKHVFISSYNLRSSSFSLEGIKIPSFIGTVTLFVTSNPTFCNYINMLCDYAEYCGVGIKTALGMGQVKRIN